MADDIGTPAVADPAEGLSPTFTSDTSGQGTKPDVGGATDETAKFRQEAEQYRTELEELKRKSAGQTLSWQQERAEREKLEKRMQRWRDNKVDPDEIDRAIDAFTSQQGGGQQTGQMQLPANVMTTEQFQRMQTIQEWERQKENWFEKNPDFQSEETGDWFDTRARRIAEKELAEFGRIISTPKEVLKKVAADFNKFHAGIEKKALEKATQTRQAVGQQGVVESGHQKVKVEREDSEFKAETNEQFEARMLEQQRRIRGRGK